ncbi:MAG: hypothetical protein M1835_006818 [Candelina submexicana]|nr:MAG: hypothetical protein M1835_006818 [Candelina submexicana]
MSNTSTSQTTKSPEGQAISEVAKAEGGPSKGSASAQMQSEVAKQRNAEQDNTGSNTTSMSPEGRAISEVSKAEGGVTKGSTAAKMQSEVSKKRNAEQGLYNTTGLAKTGTNPSTQGQADREQNFAEVASAVKDKIITDPESVTPEDANLARSRETRAFGATEKGGVASTAQSLASQNEKKGTV